MGLSATLRHQIAYRRFEPSNVRSLSPRVQVSCAASRVLCDVFARSQVDHRKRKIRKRTGSAAFASPKTDRAPRNRESDAARRYARGKRNDALPPLGVCTTRGLRKCFRSEISRRDAVADIMKSSMSSFARFASALRDRGPGRLEDGFCFGVSKSQRSVRVSQCSHALGGPILDASWRRAPARHRSLAEHRPCLRATHPHFGTRALRDCGR